MVPYALSYSLSSPLCVSLKLRSQILPNCAFSLRRSKRKTHETRRKQKLDASCAGRYGQAECGWTEFRERGCPLRPGAETTNTSTESWPKTSRLPSTSQRKKWAGFGAEPQGTMRARSAPRIALASLHLRKRTTHRILHPARHLGKAEP